ncbi:amidohydrolase [Marinobacter lutaoensis]|uniref:Amidohydrolase n=1 Tax=Marinobacter lutaoensis TaxID=135739 RepID=A0A1V2DRS5_9GAMM|nr:amidohydrolase family protein [Marinobacter lutaoensis]ONF43425.1 amidohydrolase [Marinobacter lutaoensis]
MRVVDPHLHFWSLAEQNQGWLSQPVHNLLGDYTPMVRDFGPQQLMAERGEIELEAFVHVEANADNPLAETQWLSQLLTRKTADLPYSLVVHVNLAAEDAEQQLLDHIALSPRVTGVRQILNVHADPLFDYVGYHFMSDERWLKQLSLLAQYNLSFDLQIYPDQMAQAAQVIAQHPDIQFILNHAGMYVDRVGPQGWCTWRDGIRQLATLPNVAVKLSGFGMLDHEPTANSIRPLVYEVIDQMGVERVMFASNYPVESLYCSYEEIWQCFAALVANASATDKEAMFAANARRFYRL